MLSSPHPPGRYASRLDPRQSSSFAVTHPFASSCHSSLERRAARLPRSSRGHVLKSFTIRTSATRDRNPFIIRTCATHLDLRIPKDLLHRNFSRNSFSFCTYSNVRNYAKQTAYNPCRIRTYKKSARNSFRIRTSKNPGVPSSPSTDTPSLLSLSAPRRETSSLFFTEDGPPITALSGPAPNDLRLPETLGPFIRTM
jgi:hypothetical protein